MCLYPKLIQNPKYKPNKKNKGKPPVCNDMRVSMVPIGCGKCMECRKQKKREWQVRLLEEVENNKSGQFVTLSFSDEELVKLEAEALKENPKLEGYELDNRAAIIAVRKFTENWRNDQGSQPRRWLITELGHKNTERIHLHGIIWTRNKNLIKELWKYGNVYIGNYVNGATANYIVKYVTKTDIDHPNYQPRILCSKGIGEEYIRGQWAKHNGYNGEKTKDYYTTKQGYKISLPIYYRNKIYSDEERESLWINRLDKEERYVNGIRIDISKSDKEYYNLLNQTRRLNKQLGYGTDEKNWSIINYEKQRRELKRLERLKKTEMTNEKNNNRINNDSDADNYLYMYGKKEFNNRKDDRIQKIEGKMINTYTGEILGEYEEENKKEVIRGIDKDKESIQMQIWI